MIFVTVGTHSQQFNRLVSVADELANLEEEEIIIQYGHSTYPIKYAKGFAFTSAQKMIGLIQKSRVVICQSAAGSIIMAIKEMKPLVLIPRLKKYKENHTDHQLELGLALHQAKKAICLLELTPSLLADAIRKAMELNPFSPSPHQLVQSLREQINNWEMKTI